MVVQILRRAFREFKLSNFQTPKGITKLKLRFVDFILYIFPYIKIEFMFYICWRERWVFEV